MHFISITSSFTPLVVFPVKCYVMVTASLMALVFREGICFIDYGLLHSCHALLL